MSIDKGQLTKTLTDFVINELARDQGIETLGPDDDLLEDSVVDSLGIMRLIGFIEQEVGFVVPSEDVVIENFLTVGSIVNYLVPKLSENAN